jgi:hypothetical protein
VPRFANAVVGALALHGMAALVRAPRPPESPTLIAQAPAAHAIEVEEFPVEEAAQPVQPAATALLPTPSERLAVSAPAKRVASPLSAATATELKATAEAAPDRATPPPADTAATTAGASARKIDLGLDGHFFLHALGPAEEPGRAPAAELGPRARKSTAEQQLAAALSAADVQRGLARGNALVGPLHSAVHDEGPLRGEAIFRATIAADGSFGNAELVVGSATDWSAVLSAFRKLAASKHVRVPPGAKGLRVTFSVKAKVQRPSGKETNESPVYVAPPSPLPIGVGTQGDFDLADAAGGAQRVVYARVIAEEVL